MVIVVGFTLPERSPPQPEKTQPDAGVAVSWTLDPEAYDDWLGLLDTDPCPEMVTVTVY
jgi:hypothetical protein